MLVYRIAWYFIFHCENKVLMILVYCCYICCFNVHLCMLCVNIEFGIRFWVILIENLEIHLTLELLRTVWDCLDLGCWDCFWCLFLFLHDHYAIGRLDNLLGLMVMSSATTFYFKYISTSTECFLFKFVLRILSIAVLVWLCGTY